MSSSLCYYNSKVSKFYTFKPYIGTEEKENEDGGNVCVSLYVAVCRDHDINPLFLDLLLQWVAGGGMVMFKI